MEKENQPHIRFGERETPPGSPKSCLKGSRKLTFEEKSVEPSCSDVKVTVTSTPKSPRRGTKVCIRSPGDNSSPPESPPEPEAAVVPVPEVEVVPPFQKPPDIQFSQHYDQSTPPPNCTSNGAYDFPQQDQPADPSNPRNDPQLMEVASKFVNEIIETATLEAANRQKAEQGEAKPNLSTIARDILATGRRSVWVQRAHGTVSKWFNNLCVKAQNSIRT